MYKSLNINKHSLKNNNEILLILLIIVCIYEPIIFKFYQPSNIEKYIMYALPLSISTLIFFNILFNGIKVSLFRIYILSFLSIIYSIGINFLKPYTINTNSIVKFIAIFIIFSVCNINFKRKHMVILFISFLSTFFLIFFKSLNYSDWWIFSPSKGYMYNPNTIAFNLVLLFMYLNIFIKNINNKFKKIFLFLLFFLTVMALLRLGSRTNLAELLIFVFFDWILPKKFWKNQKRIIFVIISIIVSNFIITLTYIWMYKNNFTIDLSLMTSKNFFTGREILWKSFYEEIGNNFNSFLIGFDWAKVSPVMFHNKYLDMICANGIIGFIMYYLFILKIIYIIYSNKVSTLQISFILIYITTSIAAIFDFMVTFPQNLILYLSLGFALLLCKEKIKYRTLFITLNMYYRNKEETLF